MEKGTYYPNLWICHHLSIHWTSHWYLLSILYQALPRALSIHRGGFLPLKNRVSHSRQRRASDAVDYAHWWRPSECFGNTGEGGTSGFLNGSSDAWVGIWKIRIRSKWGQEEKGTAEDEMVGWHHRLHGHGFGWTPGVGDGQGGLACCDSWGRKELDMTERLNWTEADKKHICN